MKRFHRQASNGIARKPHPSTHHGDHVDSSRHAGLAEIGWRLAGKLEINAAALTEVPRQARLFPYKDLPVLTVTKHFGSLFGKTVGRVLILIPGDYLSWRS
jgi:hypothetical protein